MIKTLIVAVLKKHHIHIGEYKFKSSLEEGWEAGTCVQ